MVRSIAAKYCVDISTVLEVIKEVKKEIKKKWIDNKTLLKVVNMKVTQAHIDSFLSWFNSKIGKRVKTKQMQNHLRGDNVLEKNLDSYCDKNTKNKGQEGSSESRQSLAWSVSQENIKNF